MTAPSSRQSSVYQLNMGEGKSSVIVPLAVTALADSNTLVRVIVLKSLAGSMFPLLVERLCGLANRRVFYLPFSRGVTIDMAQLKRIQNLFEECVRSRGVLVAQPEHILSFKLMVIDRTLSSSSTTDVARALQDTQTWLSLRSRDILDESDELLHVRYQLIYTMGTQQPLDDSPDRWTTTQQIFDLVQRHGPPLQEQYPDEVALSRPLGTNSGDGNHGEFRHIRLLGEKAGDVLVERIATDVLASAVDNLVLVNMNTNASLRASVFRFITKQSINSEEFQVVRRQYQGSTIWTGLLLIRGLLAYGILVYVLSQRRWRVDYGLDLKRSLLAVPYRAKVCVKGAFNSRSDGY